MYCFDVCLKIAVHCCFVITGDIGVFHLYELNLCDK